MAVPCVHHRHHHHHLWFPTSERLRPSAKAEALQDRTVIIIIITTTTIIIITTITIVITIIICSVHIESWPALGVAS